MCSISIPGRIPGRKWINIRITGPEPTIEARKLFKIIEKNLKKIGVECDAINGIGIVGVSKSYYKDDVVVKSTINGKRVHPLTTFYVAGPKPREVRFDDSGSSRGSSRSSLASERSSTSSDRSSQESSGSRFSVLASLVDGVTDKLDDVVGVVKALASDVKMLKADGKREDASSSRSTASDNSRSTGSSKSRNRKRKAGSGKHKGSSGKPKGGKKPADGAATATDAPGTAAKGAAKSLGKPDAASASSPPAPRSRLLFGNLPYSISSSDLHTLLVSHGALSAEVAVDGSGRSEGYGFATFADEEAAKSARNAFDGSAVRRRKISVSVVRDHLSAVSGGTAGRPASESKSGKSQSPASGAHQPVSTVLEAYKLLSSPSGEGRALHKSCYVAANGLQIIPVTGHKNSCPAASVLTAVSGKHLQLEKVTSYFDRVYTPWMQLLSKLDRAQVEALVAPRNDKGEVDVNASPMLTAGLLMERSAEYVAERASAGNATDIAMMAFLVNYDGIVIKALHSGDDEGSAAPDMRYLSATSTFIPRIGLGRRNHASPLPAGCKFAAAGGAIGYTGHYDALRNVTGTTTSKLPSPDDMRRAAATRLRDLVAATRDSRAPFSLNEELIAEFEAGPQPLQSEQGSSGKAAAVIELSEGEDEDVDPEVADAERALAELKAAKAKVKALAAAKALAEAEAAAASAAAKAAAAAPAAASKGPSALAKPPSAPAQASRASAAAKTSPDPDASATGELSKGMFKGGASKPVDPERRETAMRLAQELLLAQGDDLCKEWLFGLPFGSLTDAEPDRREAVVKSLRDSIENVIDSVLHPHPSTATRQANGLFKRLAAYTRGHANLTRNGGSVRSGESMEQLSTEDQRTLLQSYEPLFLALHPNFKLDSHALVNSGHYDEPLARSVLPPVTAGSQ